DGVADTVSDGVVGEKIDDTTYRYTNTGAVEGTVQLRDYTIKLSAGDDTVEIERASADPARNQPGNLNYTSISGDIEIRDNNTSKIMESTLNQTEKAHYNVNLLVAPEITLETLSGTMDWAGFEEDGDRLVESTQEAGESITLSHGASLSIQTNTSAINAMRMLDSVSGALANSVERLSSGIRINRANDDASGLAISEMLAGPAIRAVGHDGNEGRVWEAELSAGDKIGATVSTETGENETLPFTPGITFVGRDVSDNPVVEITGDIDPVPFKLAIKHNPVTGELEMRAAEGAFVALAMDFAGLYAAKAQLQNPADKGALESDRETGEVTIRAESGTLTISSTDGYGEKTGYVTLDEPTEKIASRINPETNENELRSLSDSGSPVRMELIDTNETRVAIVPLPTASASPRVATIMDSETGVVLARLSEAADRQLIMIAVDNDEREVADLTVRSSAANESDRLAFKMDTETGGVEMTVKAASNPAEPMQAEYKVTDGVAVTVARQNLSLNDQVRVKSHNSSPSVSVERMSPNTMAKTRLVPDNDARVDIAHGPNSKARIVKGLDADRMVIAERGDVDYECTSGAIDKCSFAKVERISSPTGDPVDVERVYDANIQLRDTSGTQTLLTKDITESVAFRSIQSDGVAIAEKANIAVAAKAYTTIDGNEINNPSGAEKELVQGDVAKVPFGEVDGVPTVDEDGDGLAAPEDACTTSVGPVEFQGCPVGVGSLAELHIIDQAKSGACDG
ncbi:MAG: flagellin N-terminal helical domain-containing protein, partial [Candidatus Thorarchaeota archaeon]